MSVTKATALRAKLTFALLFPAVILPSAPISAADRSIDPAPQPELFRQLMDCRQIADTTERLACFDKQSAALDIAAQKKEIVIADKQAVQRAKRGLFGFAAPVAKLMGFGGSEEDANEIKEVSTTVETARRGANGWIVGFADGSTWEQNDMKDMVLSPKPGNEARITRGALGTYFVSVRGQPAIKMRRVQ